MYGFGLSVFQTPPILLFDLSALCTDAVFYSVCDGREWAGLSLLPWRPVVSKI